jgi:hypothetical protein
MQSPHTRDCWPRGDHDDSGVVGWLRGGSEPGNRLSRFQIALPEKERRSRSSIAISPDAMHSNRPHSRVETRPAMIDRFGRAAHEFPAKWEEAGSP